MTPALATVTLCNDGTHFRHEQGDWHIIKPLSDLKEWIGFHEWLNARRPDVYAQELRLLREFEAIAT